MHEIGHSVGYEHEADGLMAETLSAGVREAPVVEVEVTSDGYVETLDASNPSPEVESAAANGESVEFSAPEVDVAVTEAAEGEQDDGSEAANSKTANPKAENTSSDKKSK